MSYGNKEITVNNILELISEYDIFKYYCPSFKGLNKGFRSELYRDNKASCYIYVNKGRLWYKDFGTFEHYDCFSYVQKKYNIKFQEALVLICNDFNLNLGSFTRKKPSMVEYGTIENNIAHSLELSKIPTEIRVSIRQFNSNKDKYFWRDQYDLTSRDLIEANVFALDYFWINDRCYIADECCYGYYFGEAPNGIHRWKIYQPYSKSRKWSTNCERGHLQGIDLLPWTGDKLLITKSYKDVLVLKRLGYNAIAPHGEGHKIGNDQIKQLKKRFNRIDVLYDNDEVGLQAAIILSNEHSLGNMVLPQFMGKDPSDFVKYKGYNELSNFLQSCYT